MSVLARLGLTRVKKEATPPISALEKMTGALYVSLDSIQKAGLPDEEREAMFAESLRQFEEAVSGEISKAGGVIDCPECGQKMAKGTKECPQCGHAMVAKAEDDYEDPIHEGDTMDEKALAEAVSKAVTEQLTPISKKLETAEKENGELREKVGKMAADEAERTILAKAATLVSTTGIAVADAAEILKHLPPEVATKFEGIMKAHKQSTSDAALLTEIGSAVGEAGAPIEVEVSKIMAADSKLTRPQAIAKAVKANPKLYDETIK